MRWRSDTFILLICDFIFAKVILLNVYVKQKNLITPHYKLQG